MTRYDISMGKIEGKLRSLKEIKERECGRTGRKINGADDDGDAAAYDARRRR